MPSMRRIQWAGGQLVSGVLAFLSPSLFVAQTCHAFAMSVPPPGPQQMVADPLVDAAVRQCDDFLSSSTVAFHPLKVEQFDVVYGSGFFDAFSWVSRSGKIPITSGDDKNAPPALFVTISVPKYDEFIFSITTADGRIVARTSPLGGPGAPVFPPAEPGTWVEWGGKHHGHLDHDFATKAALCPCWSITTKNSVGPSEAVSVRDNTLSPVYVGVCCGLMSVFFAPLVLIPVALCAPRSFDVVNRATGQRLCRTHRPGDCCDDGSIKINLEGLNQEQRRLTLLAFIYEYAQEFSKKPQRNDGGGGGGDGV